MRLIEIQDGISINVDKIDGIEEDSPTTCKVYVGSHTYQAMFPYSTLLSMLKTEDVIDKKLSREESSARTMEKLDKVLEKAQHFAG